MVNNAETDFAGKEIKLTASIDFSESTNTWEPIGVGVLNMQYVPPSLNEAKSKPFKGIFNGNNQTIKGIKTDDQKEVSGLFGVNRGTIKNIGVINSEIKGKAYIGGVAGWNEATISNSYNTGSVSSNGARSYAGGVVAWNRGNIENSYYNTDSPIDGKTICDKGKGKTTSEMKDVTFAKELGSAFINPKPLNLNKGLPVLRCLEELRISKIILKAYNKRIINLKNQHDQLKILSNDNKEIRVEDLQK